MNNLKQRETEPKNQGHHSRRPFLHSVSEGKNCGRHKERKLLRNNRATVTSVTSPDTSTLVTLAYVQLFPGLNPPNSWQTWVEK